MALGHRQPAERPNRRGCRTAARHRRLVEHSNMDPKDQEDLQEERDEELHGPQGSRQEVVYTFKPLPVTHRLPVQQGQDYPEGDYTCV